MVTRSSSQAIRQRRGTNPPFVYVFLGIGVVFASVATIVCAQVPGQKSGFLQSVKSKFTGLLDPASPGVSEVAQGPNPNQLAADKVAQTLAESGDGLQMPNWEGSHPVPADPTWGFRQPAIPQATVPQPSIPDATIQQASAQTEDADVGIIRATDVSSSRRQPAIQTRQPVRPSIIEFRTPGRPGIVNGGPEGRANVSSHVVEFPAANQFDSQSAGATIRSDNQIEPQRGRAHNFVTPTQTGSSPYTTEFPTAAQEREPTPPAEPASNGKTSASQPPNGRDEFKAPAFGGDRNNGFGAWAGSSVDKTELPIIPKDNRPQLPAAGKIDDFDTSPELEAPSKSIESNTVPSDPFHVNESFSEPAKPQAQGSGRAASIEIWGGGTQVQTPEVTSNSPHIRKARTKTVPTGGSTVPAIGGPSDATSDMSKSGLASEGPAFGEKILVNAISVLGIVVCLLVPLFVAMMLVFRGASRAGTEALKNGLSLKLKIVSESPLVNVTTAPAAIPYAMPAFPYAHSAGGWPNTATLPSETIEPHEIQPGNLQLVGELGKKRPSKEEIRRQKREEILKKFAEQNILLREQLGNSQEKAA